MQEKQKQVLEVFKEMQEKGIFTMLRPDNNLDILIKNAVTYNDIAKEIPTIKEYVKDLEFELSTSFNVSISENLSDFNDKIQDEIYNIYLEAQEVKTKIYQKELDNGQHVGISTLGLKNRNADKNNDVDVRFTLEERKILKLINHYYLSLNPKKNDVTYFFIPMNQLKIIFKNTCNHKLIKDSVIVNCKRLQNKVVYWNYSKTAFAKSKKLIDKRLDISKGSSLVNITLLFAPYDKNNNLELRGIACKVNKFMKLRLALNQFSNLFPTRAIKANYLEYVMISKMIYLMSMSTNKKRGYVKINLANQLKTIYTLNKSVPSTSNYLSFIRKDDHKPRELKRFMQALIDIALDFKSLSMYSWDFKIIANIFRGNSHIDTVEVPLMKNDIEPRNFNAIYSELERIYSEQYKQIKNIQSLCNKLGNGSINYDTIIKKSQNTSISKEVIDNLFKDISNKLDVEDVRNQLIENLSYTQGKIQETVILGRIIFHVDFKEIQK